jgi:hypothetical protein
MHNEINISLIVSVNFLQKNCLISTITDMDQEILKGKAKL